MVALEPVNRVPTAKNSATVELRYRDFAGLKNPQRQNPFQLLVDILFGKFHLEPIRCFLYKHVLLLHINLSTNRYRVFDSRWR